MLRLMESLCKPLRREKKSEKAICKFAEARRIKMDTKSKRKNIKEGEAYTKFFHAKANGRHRINTIVSLENEGEVIVRQKNLEKFITSFYKKIWSTRDI